MNARRIAIRVDASVRVGAGHLMRCLAVADALSKNGAEVIFITSNLREEFIAQVTGRGYGLQELSDMADEELDWHGDALRTRECLQEMGPCDILIVDHYMLDINWERIVHPLVERLVVIDDLANRKHECDVLIDQNLVRDFEHRYDTLVPAGCKRLLGPRYALLRPEFAAARSSMRIRDGNVRRILVFFGATDPSNETEKFLEAWVNLSSEKIRVDVVIGAANPNRLAIQGRCSTMKDVHFHCQVDNIASLMSLADLSIGAGGVTTWERCCLGLPSIVVAVAENQVSGAEELARRGAILYMGLSADVAVADMVTILETALANPFLLIAVGCAAFAIADGRGLIRLGRIMGGNPVRIRSADRSDCDAALLWRNHDSVRKYSFSTKKIDENAHRKWFRESLENPCRKILIGEVAGESIGILRFDLNGSLAEVSIYLDPEKMGRGYGTFLLEAGDAWLSNNFPEITLIEAHIIPENIVSIKAFSETGYVPKNMTFRKVRKDA